ncbi:hypothetical protein [Fodinibius halophilus]|uniref:Uncharacterized protein n=1 Tax=Fodinibius halophilus TaxID=1736908 RepID=A0A6M1T911_9BACT|nr:hypothetical protein [Fodinibius halophilus]NGP89935.1 hypothetical protein [Fodinibius halophilus]
MFYFKSTKKPAPIALSLGILGGTVLIITTLLTSKGFAIFIPYTALIIATFAVLRAVHWSSFSKRFTTSFLTFMVATIILYLFIGIFDAGTILEIPVLGHIWRFGLLAVIGGALSFAVAYLADVGRSQITE